MALHSHAEQLPNRGEAIMTADLLCLGAQLRRARIWSAHALIAERQQRLDEIRKAVANGSYRTDAAALAKALLRRQRPRP